MQGINASMVAIAIMILRVWTCFDLLTLLNYFRISHSFEKLRLQVLSNLMYLIICYIIICSGSNVFAITNECPKKRRSTNNNKHIPEVMLKKTLACASGVRPASPHWPSLIHHRNGTRLSGLTRTHHYWSTSSRSFYVHRAYVHLDLSWFRPGKSECLWDRFLSWRQ